MVILFITLTFSFSLWAQADIPGPSFEEVISLRSARGPNISPDGRSIVFGMRTIDWKKNGYDSEIWLVRDGEEPFQLTRTADGSSWSPQWSPDGRWIAFIADRGDKSQIYLIRADGGEAQQITDVEEGVSSFRWAPDGSRIAFTMSEKEKKEEKERKERYGEFAVEDKEYRYTHLWIVDVKPDPWPSPVEVPCYDTENSNDSPNDDGNEPNVPYSNCVSLPKPKRLTEGDSFTVFGFEWSPDGARIAFDHRTDPLVNSSITSNISVLTVETGDIRSLVTGPGYDGGPIWSPDSKWILYHTTAGDTTSYYYKNGQLHKIPSEGGKSIRIAEDLDEDESNIAWTPEGIYLLAWQRTKYNIFQVDPNTGKTNLFASTPDNIWRIDFSKDGRTIAFSGQESTSLAEIYRTSLSPFRPIKVTNMSRQIENWELGTSEIISWKSKDGTTIEGVLHKPHAFDPNQKYPLFVVIHGGPMDIDIPSIVPGGVYPITQWLAKGALVLQPNYRGSTGYGEAFRSLNVRNLGIGDAWDVLSGVDYLIEQENVDSTRLGAMGWSWGGYISAFLTTSTNRFKAISVGAGITNLTTFYANTDIHPFIPQYLKTTPWEDPGIYSKTSPMTNIKQVCTPTLIQHGELDKRVPIPNAYELYQGLLDMNVETKLIVYKGFRHSIRKPKERLAAVWHNWQWFAKHIWGEEVELPLKREAKKDSE
jgi:dipeptidyl aminopeptidase/acylaminoacyl peptidase